MRSGLLAPFRETSFRLFWLGQSVSYVGDGIFPVALVLDLLHDRQSGTTLGYVLGVRSAATLGTVLVGGLIADRMRRTRLMAVANALRAAAVVGFALAPARSPTPILLVLAAAMGAGSGLFRPAYGALLPSLLPGTQLEAGNAIMAITARLAQIAGPTAGGALTLTIGPRWAFVADAVTFAVSFATLVAIVEPPTARSERGTMRAQTVEAIAALRERPWIAAVIATGLVQVLFVVAPASILVPLWLNARGATAVYGPALAVQAVGAVVGAVIAARWQPRYRGAIALLGPVAISGPLLVVATNVWIAALPPAMFAGSIGTSFFIVYWRSALQREVPRRLLGRVFSLDYLGSSALEPVGLALTAPAVSRLGFAWVAAIAVIVLVTSSLLALAAPGAVRFATPRPAQRPSEHRA